MRFRSARAMACSVHVMLDWVGSQKMDEPRARPMREAGVEIEKYHPLRWYTLNRLNNRTHRKLLVVDGRIGFTGGVGIADNWSGHAQDAEHWRDTHYRIEGPRSPRCRRHSRTTGPRSRGRVLHTADYFPPLQPAGPQFAQVFQSSSEGGAESMHLMYLLSIAAAAKSIHLSMAYFVPDEVTRETLDRGAGPRRQGADHPAGPDSATPNRCGEASRAGWGELLERGAEIYEYQPTMFHCKVLTVDGLWTSVGSTNFDSRSFRLNDEANLNVYDREFAQRQIADFEEDLKQFAARDLRGMESPAMDRKIAAKALCPCSMPNCSPHHPLHCPCSTPSALHRAQESGAALVRIANPLPDRAWRRTTRHIDARAFNIGTWPTTQAGDLPGSRIWACQRGSSRP